MTLFERKDVNGFYDAWESRPEDYRQDQMRRLLKQTILFARQQVPFYKDRLNAFEPRSDYPLANVPTLDCQAVRPLLPPQSEALVAGNRHDFTVFQSGGTTGMPKTTLFSDEEFEALAHPNARGFFAVGLIPSDRVANLWAVGGLYMTFLHINRMLQQYGCTSFPFSNHTPASFVHTVTRLFQINCFSGIASVVLNTLRQMTELGLDGIQIEKIYYGGEHLYEADRKELESKFGIRQIFAPGYGTVDSWYLGYQCLKCPPGVFHAHDDQVYLEILEENSNQPCRAEQTGMLYATPFLRRLTPIIRYRIGDRAHWLGRTCDCGRTTPLFQLLGRGDDVLRIGYDSIDYNSVQEVICKTAGCLGSVQMEKQREQGRDKLIIRVETEVPADQFGRLSQELEERILDYRPMIKEFVSKNSIWPLQIELVPPGGLPRNSRTGKLIRVIDAL
ncbi:MAG: hypothetical protein HY537_01885 [Deltaproteobacteria bacterium]|nr:hypothetical protein [Deltaproteobacteria bacterium]